jgi:hypothetical protein
MRKCPACGNYYNDLFFWKRRRCPFCKHSTASKPQTSATNYTESEPIFHKSEELPTETVSSFEEKLQDQPIRQLLEKNERILLTGEKFSSFLYITGFAFLIFLLIPETGFFFLAVIFGQIIDFSTLASSPNIYLTNNRVIIKEKYSAIRMDYDAITAIAHYPKGVFKQSELVIELADGKQHILERIANGREIEDFFTVNQWKKNSLDDQPPQIGVVPNMEGWDEAVPGYDVSQIPADQCPACLEKVSLNDQTCPSCGIRFIE